MNNFSADYSVYYLRFLSTYVYYIIHDFMACFQPRRSKQHARRAQYIQRPNTDAYADASARYAMQLWERDAADGTRCSCASTRANSIATNRVLNAYSFDHIKSSLAFVEITIQVWKFLTKYFDLYNLSSDSDSKWDFWSVCWKDVTAIYTRHTCHQRESKSEWGQRGLLSSWRSVPLQSTFSQQLAGQFSCAFAVRVATGD